MPQEGKSTVAARLAIAYAQTGKRTLLVECDFRRPVLADRFGLERAPGMTDYLTGNAEPHAILQRATIPTALHSSNGNTAQVELQGAGNLVCITAGSTVPLPAELLASDTFRRFVGE